MTKSHFKGCVVGVAVKDGSEVELLNVSITDYKENPVALYQKNSRYSSGGIISGDQLSGFSLDEVEVGIKSINRLDESNFIN